MTTIQHEGTGPAKVYKPPRHWPWAQRIVDRIAAAGRERAQLRTDLRMTVLGLRKAIAGTDKEKALEPMLKRIYDDLCP